MNCFDISKMFFATEIYPGDPAAKSAVWYSKDSGHVCNLHTIKCGTHTATHIDAPSHYIENGKTVDMIDLDLCSGFCVVINYDDRIDFDALKKMLEYEDVNKILLKGNKAVDYKMSKWAVENNIELIGTELSTVGDEKTGKNIHEILLGNEIVILENIDLSDIKAGKYFLSALPLKMEEMDGSPVRAALWKE